MKIEDFLEKKESFQVQIIKALILASGQLSYQSLRSHLGISKGSLESYLGEIVDYLETYGEDCYLTNDGQKVELFLSGDFPIFNVYRDYVTRSLKYQLLDYVFQHREFTVVKITSDLAISESSLFRKIKEVNDLLKEFNLQIKNGSLQGEELQIRYFYFQLYWSLTPYRSFQANLLSDQNLRLINGVEKELEIKINEFSRIRLSLWLTISKKRATLTDKKYQGIKGKMKDYQKDSLYLKVRRLVLLYFSRYSIEVGEEESMLHYVFLTSMSILSEKDFSTYDLFRSKRTPTAVVDTLLRETVLLHYRPRKPSIALERQMSYYLSQINSRLYFFEGDIEVYDQAHFIARENKFLGSNLAKLSQELLRTALAYFHQPSVEKDTLQKVTLLEYGNVLGIMDLKISKELTIGIDLRLTEVYSDILSQLLMLNLKNLVGVTVENYRGNRDYDLVITNTLPLAGYSGLTETYVISEFASAYDIKKIKERISELKM